MESDVVCFCDESKFCYPDEESSKENLTNVMGGKVSPQCETNSAFHRGATSGQHEKEN